jgi:1-acyl-sn-glycerol-3-phosphate acyltransferase
MSVHFLYLLSGVGAQVWTDDSWCLGTVAVMTESTSASGRSPRSFIFVLLHSLWVWGTLGALTLLWLPLMALTFAATAWWDTRRFWTSRLFRKLAAAHRSVVPTWTYTIDGSVPATGGPFLIVANHVSVADILLLAHLDTNTLFLTKSSLVRSPVLGWCMRMAGDIEIVRGDAGSRDTAMAECKKALEVGNNVIIYPEGTRSRTGELGEFRVGAFLLAAQTGTPVLPVVVTGAEDCIAARGWRTGPGSAVARVLPLLTTVSGIDRSDSGAVAVEADRLRADAQRLIAAGLNL